MYPLWNLAEGIEEQFSPVLGNVGYHGAQGKDNKAIVSWVVHKFFQVLREGWRIYLENVHEINSIGNVQHNCLWIVEYMLREN